MKKGKVLTIVIPAYNMEKYISKTLDSLICASIDDLEVIIVNDGSTDGTEEIAKQYVNRYPHSFSLINKENGGHGSALNVGIKCSTGKYFRPLDADDWVDTDALEAVIHDLKINDADMVLTNFRKILEQSGQTINVRMKNVWNRKEIKEGKAKPKEGRNILVYGQVYDFDKELFDYNNQYLFHFVSYRTELLKDNNIKFDEHVYYDDMEYDVYPLPYVKTVLPIDRYLYQYRLEREGQSVDDKAFAKNHRDRRLVVKNILSYYLEHEEEFGFNVKEVILDDIIWKIQRQYDIYLTLMPVNAETRNELMEFSRDVRNTSAEIFDRASTKRVVILEKSNGLLFPIIANKKIQRIIWNFKHRNEPNKDAKAWTKEADVPMHKMIRRRNILSIFHLWWFSKEMRRMHRFKNIHKGERVFITCPGPSMTIKDLELLKNEYTIGVNSIIEAYAETEWRPTYYMAIDYFSVGQELARNDVVGNTFCQREAFFHYRINPKTKNGRETYMLINYSNHFPEYFDKGIIKYSNDASVCVYDGFTVTNSAIQLAIYMGFKKIYIIGADCDYSKPQIHFIEAPGDKEKIASGALPYAANLSIDGYIAMREFAYKKHIEIYNVTRGGKLEVFYRDNLERVLQEK